MNLNRRKNILNINIGIKTFKKSSYILFENSLGKNKNKKINKKQILFLSFFKNLKKEEIKYYLYGKKFDSLYSLNIYKTNNLITLVKFKHIIFNSTMRIKLESLSWKNCLIKCYFLKFKPLFFFNFITKKKLEKKV
jgi:hypothetical protein